MHKQSETYNKQLSFAKQIGFKTPAQAIIGIGKQTFLNRFKNEYNGLIDDVTPIKRLKKPNKIKMSKPIPEGGKLIEGFKDYFIYSDGKMYSTKTERFLNAVKITSKSSICYYYYMSGTKKSVSHLVYFYFGEHNYTHISQLPFMVYNDGDYTNNDISNISEKVNKWPVRNKFLEGREVKMFEKDIPKVKDLILIGMGIKQIGSKFGVSHSCVKRFLERYNLTDWWYENKIT